MAINLIPASQPTRLANGGISPDDIARRDAIARALLDEAKPKQIAHPLQGVAQLSDAFFGGMVDQKVKADQAENRNLIADALGTSENGQISPEKLNMILAIDPELGAQILAQQREERLQAERFAREDALRSEDRGWAVEDRNLMRDWQVGDRNAEWQREDPIRDIQIGTGQEQLDQLKEGYRQLVTPEERAAAGIRADDPGMYQLGPNGAVEPIGGKGGQTINVNTGDGADTALNKALSEAEGKSWAAYKDAAGVSGSNAQDFAVLDELLQVAPQGPVTGRLAEMFQGFSSAGDAVKSIVKRIAPTLRVPGSGATSDIEYAGMLQSLAQLPNTPEANTMIMSIMKAKQDINIRRGEIVTAYQNGDIDIGTARQQMGDLNRMSIITPEMKEALMGVGADASVGTTSTGLNWSVEP